MKGYVKVEISQVQEAIEGFTLRYNQGKLLCEDGAKRYHKKFYTENGSWYTKWKNKDKTPKEFTRSKIPPWHSWDDVLWEVMDTEEIHKVSFYCRYSLSALDGPKAMVEESCDGFALVDSEMAKAINTYRSYLN